MNEVTISFGATNEQKDQAMLAYAAGRQPANWQEANIWRQVGLLDDNPFPDPAAGMFERRKAVQQVQRKRPAWHSMFIAPCLLFVLLAIPSPAIAAPSEIVTYNVAVYYDQNHNEAHNASDPGVGGQEIEMVVWPCNPNDPACTTPQQRTLGHTDANGNVSFQAESTSHLIAFCYGNIYRFPVVGCRHPGEPLEYGVSTIFNQHMPLVKSE